MSGIAPITALAFLTAGFVYGKLSGSVGSIRRETGTLMAHGVKELGPVIALFFFISQLVAYFQRTNIAGMLAVWGASMLQAINLPIPLLLALLIVVVAIMCARGDRPVGQRELLPDLLDAAQESPEGTRICTPASASASANCAGGGASVMR
ncbi:AbgT family transporter [Brachybacterium sacelli]